MNDKSFLHHTARLLAVNSGRLRSRAWKVASADSSTLRVVVVKREHSVLSITVSPRTRARCYSLTPPCVKANSEALFKKQLRRRCTISGNDLLTLLPLLISKQGIIRRTGADRMACFFRSKKPAPQIPVCPKRDSLILWACCKARGAGSASPPSHHLAVWGKNRSCLKLDRARQEHRVFQLRAGSELRSTPLPVHLSCIKSKLGSARNRAKDPAQLGAMLLFIQ